MGTLEPHVERDSTGKSFKVPVECYESWVEEYQTLVATGVIDATQFSLGSFVEEKVRKGLLNQEGSA